MKDAKVNDLGVFLCAGQFYLVTSVAWMSDISLMDGWMWQIDIALTGNTMIIFGHFEI